MTTYDTDVENESGTDTSVAHEHNGYYSGHGF